MPSVSRFDVLDVNSPQIEAFRFQKAFSKGVVDVLLLADRGLQVQEPLPSGRRGGEDLEEVAVKLAERFRVGAALLVLDKEGLPRFRVVLVGLRGRTRSWRRTGTKRKRE